MNDGKPDQRHWRPDFTSQIFLRRAAAGNLQVPTFLQDLVASNSGTQFRQRKACHRYWKHILKKLMAPRILGKHLNEADHKPGPNPIKWVGLQEKQTPRTLTSTLLRACRALTVRHFCGVAINIEVEQKTLARPQEMLVIGRFMIGLEIV